MSIKHPILRLCKAVLPLCACAVLGLCSACSYQELPPRTDVSAAEYQSPQPSFPSTEEKVEAEAARAEYRDAVKDL